MPTCRKNPEAVDVDARAVPRHVRLTGTERAPSSTNTGTIRSMPSTSTWFPASRSSHRSTVRRSGRVLRGPSRPRVSRERGQLVRYDTDRSLFQARRQLSLAMFSRWALRQRWLEVPHELGLLEAHPPPRPSSAVICAVMPTLACSPKEESAASSARCKVYVYPDQLGIATLPGSPSSAAPTGFAPNRSRVGADQTLAPMPPKLTGLIEREFGGFVPSKMFDD